MRAWFCIVICIVICVLEVLRDCICVTSRFLCPLLYVEHKIKHCMSHIFVISQQAHCSFFFFLTNHQCLVKTKQAQAGGAHMLSLCSWSAGEVNQKMLI